MRVSLRHGNARNVRLHAFGWTRSVAAIAFVFGVLLLAWNALQAQAPDRHAVLLTVDGTIGPPTLDYLQRGIARAEDGESAGRRAELVIVQLDTPGGLDSSMREIVKRFLAADVPVVTWVAPSGARAASAGTYMLYGSHVAAMAPATNLGSATPVRMGGGGLPGMDAPTPQSPSGVSPDDDRSGSDGAGGEKPDRDAGGDGDATTGSNTSDDAGDDDTAQRRGETAMERKVLEDAVAYIRGLADRYDRNADWAESAVRDGANLGATDALEAGVIDLVARDLEALLEQLDGREIELARGTVVLATADLRLERVEPDWRNQLLAVITSPNVAYILILVGIYGLIFEFANPGAIYPGVAGVISLLLAFYALQVMPVNIVGLALILLGLAFMIGEAFAPSFGALGIGGLVAFTMGSIMLWDDPQLNVSLPLIVITGLLAAVFLIWVLRRLWRFRKVEPTIGDREMIGEVGTARADFAQRGQVFVHGEIWNAETESAVYAGDEIEVVAVDGLRLRVRPRSRAASAS